MHVYLVQDLSVPLFQSLMSHILPFNYPVNVSPYLCFIKFEVFFLEVHQVMKAKCLENVDFKTQLLKFCVA